MPLGTPAAAPTWLAGEAGNAVTLAYRYPADAWVSRLNCRILTYFGADGTHLGGGSLQGRLGAQATHWHCPGGSKGHRALGRRTA